MTMIHSQPLDFALLDKEFSKTKAKLFTYKGAGFLGSLMADHKYIWDEDCATAWCDSVTIGFNPYFYLNVRYYYYNYYLRNGATVVYYLECLVIFISYVM